MTRCHRYCTRHVTSTVRVTSPEREYNRNTTIYRNAVRTVPEISRRWRVTLFKYDEKMTAYEEARAKRAEEMKKFGKAKTPLPEKPVETPVPNIETPSIAESNSAKAKPTCEKGMANLKSSKHTRVLTPETDRESTSAVYTPNDGTKGFRVNRGYKKKQAERLRTGSSDASALSRSFGPVESIALLIFSGKPATREKQFGWADWHLGFEG